MYYIPLNDVCVCVCVCEGCGPQLELTGEEVNKQASHCNDRKTASKRVQELSSELFFGVFVKVTSPPPPPRDTPATDGVKSEASMSCLLDL